MEKREVQISYRIVKAETKQFAIFPDKLKVGEEIKINAQFNFAANVEERSLACTSTINYMQNDQVIMVAQFSLIFAMPAETFIAFEVPEGWSVPVQFLRHLAMETSTTMRGVLIAKCEGTPVSGIILPTFNMAAVIKENFNIKRKGSDFLVDPNNLAKA
ncbi:MAG: hypothetical protein J6K74_05320 [Marinifilaceae bacterium]|nr:hypothetical protein [Marinifilaceae bacterium]